MLRITGCYRPRCCFVVLTAVLVSLTGRLNSQQSRTPALTVYVGTYADAPGHTIEIADGDGLFAVVDDAKYPLRPAGKDEFTAAGGQLVSFPRDASGKVTGYEQDGKFHPRGGAAGAAGAAARARPRPEGEGAPSA